MAFHVVSSILLRVLASKTTLWMAGIFQQPIRCFYFMVFEANTHSKKEDTTWKAMKSWVRECYIFLCTINFEVTWTFWKMWNISEMFQSNLELRIQTQLIKKPDDFVRGPGPVNKGAYGCRNFLLGARHSFRHSEWKWKNWWIGSRLRLNFSH